MFLEPGVLPGENTQILTLSIFACFRLHTMIALTITIAVVFAEGL